MRELGELVLPRDGESLDSARSALAREHGFADWDGLVREVQRRETLNSLDRTRVDQMLASDPSRARDPMRHWCDHRCVAPISYIAMIRFDADRLGLPRTMTGTGDVARALLAAGALVNGEPGDSETPLITAASYGDADVAHALIEHGADLGALASETSGGVPGGSALLHAAVFGMTDVLDLLVTAGARPRTVVEAAAAGDISGWLAPDTPHEERVLALIMASDHRRLDVLDELVAAGTPVDAFDGIWGRQALRVAAEHGRPESVRRLLAHGADPDLRGPDGLVALDLASRERRYLDNPGHDEVEAILGPLTRTRDPR